MATPIAAPYPRPPYGWGPLIPANGESTILAVREIRKGLHYYRVYLILAVVTALFAATLTLASGTPQFTGASIPNSIWNGNNASGNTGPFGSANSGVVLALAAVGSVGAIAEFILVIIAWLSWRGGVRQLSQVAGEYGTTHASTATAAEQDYGRTVLMFILGIATTVVLSVVIIFVAVSATLGTLHPGSGSSAPSAGSLAQLRGELVITILVAGAIATLFQFLQYYFASRSFQEAVGSLANPEQRSRLESGRTLMLVGGALTFVSVLPALYLGLAFLAVLPSIVLFIGFSRVVAVYDDWLASPVRPGAAGLPR